MLVKQKLAFSKKCKNMSTKQIISDATFKAWQFSSNINFVKLDESLLQHENTTVYWL